MKRLMVLGGIVCLGCGSIKQPIRTMDGQVIRATRDKDEAKFKWCERKEEPAAVNEHVILNGKEYNDSVALCADHYLSVMKPGDPSLEELRRKRDE